MILKRWQYYWLLIISALIWGHVAWATQEVANLYQASVLVEDHSPEERAKAFHSALLEVVGRVSGRKTKINSIRAEDLVARYHYEQLKNDSLRLVANFDPEAINRLLRKRKIPVWDAHRPSTLVWLVIRAEDGSYRLAGGDGPSLYQAPIQKEAKRHGLPLVWPIMDLMENAQMSMPKNKNRLVATLREASRDYPVEAVWIGRLTPMLSVPSLEGKKTWMAHWILLHGSEEEQWKTSGTEPATALMAGVRNLAERLASGDVSLSGEEPRTKRQIVKIVVEGVVSLESYAQLYSLLENQEEVAKAWLTDLNPEGRMVFSVESRGNITDLITALSQTGVLLVDKSPIDLSVSGDSALYYRLPLSSRR
jgi:hypothetical protein